VFSFEFLVIKTLDLDPGSGFSGNAGIRIRGVRVSFTCTLEGLIFVQSPRCINTSAGFDLNKLNFCCEIVSVPPPLNARIQVTGKVL
jgi:hypothetical protein